MIEEYQLRVLPETAANEQALRRYVAREKGKDERTLTAIRVLKRSIDARQRTIFVNLKVRVLYNFSFSGIFIYPLKIVCQRIIKVYTF